MWPDRPTGHLNPLVSLSLALSPSLIRPDHKQGDFSTSNNFLPLNIFFSNTKIGRKMGEV